MVTEMGFSPLKDEFIMVSYIMNKVILRKYYNIALITYKSMTFMRYTRSKLKKFSNNWYINISQMFL